VTSMCARIAEKNIKSKTELWYEEIQRFKQAI
jgi:hypothetical protein